MASSRLLTLSPVNLLSSRSLFVALALLLAGAPAIAAPKTKIVFLEITPLDASVAGGDSLKHLATIIGEQLLTELGNRGFEVLGTGEVTMMLGLDRQRQLLGCNDGSDSCLAELSGALGAPLVVSGSLARAGGQMQLTVKLVRTTDARALLRQSVAIENDAAVFSVVPGLARQIADAAAGREPATIVDQPASRIRPIPLVVTGGGAAIAVVGAILLGAQAADTSSLKQQLSTPGALDVEQALQARDGIYTQRLAGAVLTTAGIAVAAGGLIWFFAAGSDSKSSAGIVPVQGGAIVSWGGSW